MIDVREIPNGGKNLVFKVKGGVKILEGMVVAIKDGIAIPGSKTTEAIAVGVAQNMADNLLGSDGAVEVKVKRGVYKLLNSSDTPITQADLFKTAYFEDAYTVVALGTGSSAVGKILALEDEYVIVEIV